MEGAPSPELAAAVLAYFLQLGPYAQNTGDLSDIKALSDPECLFCASEIDGVAGMVNNQIHSVGGGVSIAEPAVTELDAGHWYTVDLIMHEAPSHEENQFGTLTKDYPEESTYKVQGIVLYRDGAWTVRGVSHEKVGP
ncbi:hypothetical protein ACVW07_001407 [Cellulomonas sp. URHB0016]